MHRMNTLQGGELVFLFLECNKMCKMAVALNMWGVLFVTSPSLVVGIALKGSDYISCCTIKVIIGCLLQLACCSHLNLL